MSVNKFKVGDKVRVRQGLVGGRYYSGVYCISDMANSGGDVFMVSVVGANTYKLEGYDWWWNDEMLESVEKTLYNLEKGDIVSFDNNGEKRKVLTAIDSCYLLSYPDNFTSASSWYTADDLKYYECTVQQSEVETIEINGKKYNKADVEEAIKDLKVVD